jgi:glucokinase
MKPTKGAVSTEGVMPISEQLDHIGPMARTVKDIDLAEWFIENVGLPARIENDARMALLGESYAGAARGFTDVVMMTLGTGIGGVAMIEGKLLRGKHAQAGCLGGHIPAVFNGRPCTCGAIGCAPGYPS